MRAGSDSEISVSRRREGCSPTVADFRKKAEKCFKNANPKAEDINFIWERSKWVTFPTGLRGYIGYGQVSAAGFKTLGFTASETKHGLYIR
jgi:hypothetical protein